MAGVQAIACGVVANYNTVNYDELYSQSALVTGHTMDDDVLASSKSTCMQYRSTRLFQ